MLDRLGNYLVELTDSPRGRVCFITIVAFSAGLLEFLVHQLIKHLVENEFLSIILDSLTIASAVAFISFIEVQAVQKRRRKVIEDMRVVRELNHHVRNALQVIQYASRLPEEKQQVEIIDASVARIETTLKELFPRLDDPRTPSSP
jgi:uncharacterized membrane protein